MTSKRILMLMSKTGGGHLSLAEALRDRLAGSDYEISIADPQSSAFHVHYRVLSRHALWLWSAEYSLSNTEKQAALAHRLFTLANRKPLVKLIEREHPDLIMSTYAFFSHSVAEALARLGRPIPLAVLFADPRQLHRAWLTHKDAAATLAPTRETVQEALNAGFHPERVHLTGWPVRGQFYTAFGEDAAAFRQRLNLAPNRLTIFLQGGGEGTAKFAATVENLLRLNREAAQPALQIILAAGTNAALLDRFRGVEHCYALPFTKEIAPYLAAADLIMGKAGPNMLFESVTLGKPFVATTYIPGQETPNLDFIRDHNLGWVALSAEEQYTLIRTLIQDPAQLNAVRATVDIYRRWNTSATERIPEIVRKVMRNA
jgi:UDP-N-acetylglucosamine:LPS N-acetylglucosamine transferase